jgi:DNA polymerase I-like protein with 3'-5' exonuclease and polymerase domains
MIEKETLVALDIETSNGNGQGSLNARDPDSFIALMQFGFEDGEIKITRAKEGMELLRKLNDNNVRFIIHNAFFELDWFIHKYNFPIHTMKVWCPMTASQILNAGKNIPDEASWLTTRMNKKNIDYLGKWNPLIYEDDENVEKVKTAKFSHNLQATIYRYANKAIVQKDQGNSDWASESLSEEQLRYAQDDVKYLIEVAKNQWNFVKKFNMQRVIELEMTLIAATVGMKYNGMKIDTEKWEKSAANYQKMAKNLEEDLNDRMGREISRREGQVSLFGTVVPRAFNVASPSQLTKYFNVESADEAHLRELVDKEPIVKEILEFKEYSKIASTYGKNYLKFLDPNDSRIHSMLVQTETATGRYSSRRPNLQNIPRDMLKGFITVDRGNVLLTIDYSSMESRILAYAAGDENFIKAVNSADVHWENAKNIFKLPENATKNDIFYVEAFKKNISGDELRRMSKGVSFGIPYGISAIGLVSRGFAEDEKQGQELIDGFLNQYPNVKKFLETAKAEGLFNGYTQDPFGRVRWHQKPKKGEVSDEELKKVEGAIARRSQNMKIQSMSANITKMALRDLYYFLHDTEYGKMVLTIHDSIFFELYEETAEEAIPGIIKIMEEAGPRVFDGMIVPVDADVGVKETRECIISGVEFSVYSHIYENGKVKRNNQNVDPRVYSLVNAEIQDIIDSRKKLLEVISEKDDEWRKQNIDIVKSMTM